MGRLLGIAVRDATRVPMRELSRALISTERGVERDFRGRPGERQVSVISREAWERACADLDVELPWTLRRANLLVEGLDLAETAGQQLRIGDAILEISGETDPCWVMDRQQDGLRAALTPDWRGGVSCRVLRAGEVAVGDSVGLERALAAAKDLARS